MRPRHALLVSLVAAVSAAILGVAAPAPAAAPEVAAIETTAPLADSSEEAVQAAIVAAMKKAARGALAMGLPWLRVEGAYVRPGYVGVQVIAMKKPGEDEGETPAEPNPEAAPDAEPGPAPDLAPDMSETQTTHL